MTEIIYSEEVYAIIGAAMEVHRELGCGFLEPVYQEALSIEFCSREIPFIPQQERQIKFKGKQLKKTYIADFIACDKIIVEIKAIAKLTSLEEAQVLNYLKATGMQVGALKNFGAESLEWKRVVFTKSKNSPNSRNSRINPPIPTLRKSVDKSS
jgi:GxxExxY protein